jgi:hypothetical protein
MQTYEKSVHTGSYTYDPSGEYRNWDQVVRKNHLQIRVKDNLLILTPQSRK